MADGARARQPAAGLGLPAEAADATSASYRLRGDGFAAIGRSGLLGLGGSLGGVSLGRSPTPAPSGALADLTTIAPGFWPLIQGALPSLDLDGDGLQAFLDADDDGDGLDDVVETGTGVFLSAIDTGTDPTLFDSDGVGDGSEVAFGSDPNDDGSLPGAAPIPALPALGGLVAAGLWIAVARRRLEPARCEPGDRRER